MSGYWILETHGDPLGRLQQFVAAIWNEAALDAMLVPLGNGNGAETAPALIKDRAQLQHVNPFRPLMTANAARDVPALLATDPSRRLGALLRPCEARALLEMGKHNGFRPEKLLTVGVDCLATFSPEDYAWRMQRKREAGSRLTAEALQFARQGGIVPYRYRSACQICDSPAATGADVNIHVLGLAARQHLLVSAHDEATVRRLHLDAHTDGRAPSALVQQHQRVVDKMVARHDHARERLCASLEGLLPHSATELVARFDACAGCERCMEVCPICAVDHPMRDESGQFREDDLCRWLISCAGCGMCEQACPQGQPLCAIFGYIREQLLAEAGHAREPALDAELHVF
ncbi:MAG: Coenzyme F420 hydrogenase/dehydrogenase, beta subunit C-terminal domain [Anaerolineae bacterium]|nr:Coenzyme F420 hydrogenase/dehydrogenase, beta subunit C-terminal domain [Anaerolineae bacterium]